MSHREFIIIVAHMHVCTLCRGRLLADPETLLAGSALSAEERERLARLTFDDFITPDALTRAVGISTAELDAYRDQGVVRLRHI